MKIKRRFPSFFTGFEETEHEVNTHEELLEIPWIKEYNDIKGHIGIFYSPCLEWYQEGPDLLMALTKDGDGKIYHWVVGYIYGNGADLGLIDYHKELTE